MKALIQDIWNNWVAIPKNKTGDYRLSPGSLRRIVEKHLGEEKVKTEIILRPFQVGEIYETKWQTKEKFLIKEIKTKFDKDLKKEIPYYFLGVIIGKEHLGNCPINIDRLIQHYGTH